MSKAHIKGWWGTRVRWDIMTCGYFLPLDFDGYHGFLVGHVENSNNRICHVFLYSFSAESDPCVFGFLLRSGEKESHSILANWHNTLLRFYKLQLKSLFFWFFPISFLEG